MYLSGWRIATCFGFLVLLQNSDSTNGDTVVTQIQCYACGLPKVHPENDIVGSYGTKIYNHTCDELMATMVDEKVDERFVRTCPVGVRSCFGATGYYDHDDNDPTNDIWVRFLGCSEAKYRHHYGCDRDYQNVNVRDRANRRIQVEIDVNLCFCSDHRCNHPHSDLLSSGQEKTTVISFTAMTTAAVLVAYVKNIFEM